MTIKKAILLSLLGLVLGAIVFGGVFFFTTFKKPASNNKVEVYTYDMGELYANINKSRRILKANITVETTDKKIHQDLEEQKSKIINNILETTRSKTEEDLQGDKGQKLLQKEVLKIIQSSISSNKITNVYFTEFIIQ